MRGSCLCGAIAYEVERLDSPIGHCACRTCRKAHSAAFNTYAIVRHRHFAWLRGEALLACFESSPGKRRYFCSHCGTQLVAQLANEEQLILRVASLDDDPGVVPSERIWVSHEVPWLDYRVPMATYAEEEPADVAGAPPQR